MSFIDAERAFQLKNIGQLFVTIKIFTNKKPELKLQYDNFSLQFNTKQNLYLVSDSFFEVSTKYIRFFVL